MERWVVVCAERIADPATSWKDRHELLVALANERPFRRLILADQNWDEIDDGKTDLAISMKLAHVDEAISKRHLRFASTHWLKLADTHCRRVAVLAAILAGGPSDTLHGLVPVNNQNGIPIGKYDPLLGRRHRAPEAFTMRRLRARARAVYLEAVAPGFHVLRREWRQHGQWLISLDEMSLCRAPAGPGLPRSSDDEGDLAVRETIAGDGRDVAQRMGRWRRPRKRVWYVGGEDSRDIEALIARMDLVRTCEGLSQSHAQALWMAGAGYDSRDIGAALGISAPAARALVYRGRKEIVKPRHTSAILGRSIRAMVASRPGPFYFPTRFKVRDKATWPSSWFDDGCYPGELEKTTDAKLVSHRHEQVWDAVLQRDRDDLPAWAVEKYDDVLERRNEWFINADTWSMAA